MNLDDNGRPTKYLIVGIICSLLMVIDSESNDWKLVPQTLASLWFIFTLLFTLHEIYSRITYYFHFKTFKGGGINSDKELILNTALLVIFLTGFIFLTSK